jgi:hypothetical protein
MLAGKQGFHFPLSVVVGRHDVRFSAQHQTTVAQRIEKARDCGLRCGAEMSRIEGRGFGKLGNSRRTVALRKVGRYEPASVANPSNMEITSESK